jgi:hypothetical protein
MNFQWTFIKLTNKRRTKKNKKLYNHPIGFLTIILPTIDPMDGMEITKFTTDLNE